MTLLCSSVNMERLKYGNVELCSSFGVINKFLDKENKEIEVRIVLRKSQPNFQHYVKKIEAEAKNGFLMKNVYFAKTFKLFLLIF